MCAAGGAVLLVDVDVGGDQVACNLVATGAQASFLQADVTEVGAIHGIFAAAVTRYGGLDLALHAVGAILTQGVGFRWGLLTLTTLKAHQG